LLPLREDYKRGRISRAEFKRHEETVMSNLTALCEPGIVEAVQENFIGCVLCAVGFVVEDDEVVGVSYPDIIASLAFVVPWILSRRSVATGLFMSM
jgi:hypothetical protein